jgi:transposase
MLMISWERFRLRLEEFLHDGQKMCWFLNVNWDVRLYEMWWNTWIDFLEMISEFWKTRNKDELQVIIVDNNSIHYTIDVLIECMKNWILLIPLPRYSPHLNPIEQLRKILKAYWRARFTNLNELIIWIKDYVCQNNFLGLIENYFFKFFSPNL